MQCDVSELYTASILADADCKPAPMSMGSVLRQTASMRTMGEVTNETCTAVRPRGCPTH
jgi:hypothetical protein